MVRRELKEISALGEYSAEAIQRETTRRGHATALPIRTNNNIIQRRRQFGGKRRIRRKDPPKGWYLTNLAEGRAELDSFDVAEGLVIKGARNVEVLNGVSFNGGLVCSWPRSRMIAKIAVNAILSHSRHFGFPDYVQFDKLFQGPRNIDALSRVLV